MHKNYHQPLQWISKNVCFPDSAGRELARQPVGKFLLPFQRKIIREVLDNEGNIKSNLYISGLRKCSKTFLFSAITWYLINDKKRTGFRMPVMSGIFEQAKLLYEQMICQPYDKKEVRFFKDYIKNNETKARVDFFAQSPGSVLGQENSGLIADEIGTYRSSATLYNLSTGGSLSPDNFLKLFAQNPPLTDDHFSLDLLKSCDADPSFKVYRFSLPVKKDWTDEKNWVVNPFIKEYFNSKGKRFEYVMKFYRNFFNRALSNKTEEHAFRRYLLGQFCGSEMSYIPAEKIGVCDETVYKDPSYRWCLGADYSITHDFTSLSLVGWSQQKNKIAVKCFLYLPNTTRRRETQRVQLEQWEREGHIVIQRKDVLDGKQIAEDVIAYLNKHQVCPEKICFDKALSAHHIERFAGFKKLEVRMTGQQMTSSIRELERVGCDSGLELIGDNPCLRWQFGNVIVSQKSKQFCLMNRVADSQNIDGPVAITLGLKPMIENPQKIFAGFAV